MTSVYLVLAMLAAIATLQAHATPVNPVRRVLRESLRVFPPRVGRSDHSSSMMSDETDEEISKRSTALRPFPRVGRAVSLKPFPRLGRASNLAAFPRVGRAEILPLDVWCADCILDGDMATRQGPRFLVPQPRVGKRLQHTSDKRQGLSMFPRVGRREESSHEDSEAFEENPSWYAEPSNSKRSERELDANSPLWFGPRLGRKRRHVEPTSNSQDLASPRAHHSPSASHGKNSWSPNAA